MSNYCVFQAYDGEAARELCTQLADIRLLILNTEGTGMDTPTLVRYIRQSLPNLPVLHIGVVMPAGMPEDVPNLDESFNAPRLLATVEALLHPERALIPEMSHPQ